MPKKKSRSSSLKKPSQVEDKPALQQTKQGQTPGKLLKEIDDIFAGRKKKKKTEVEDPEKKETTVEIAKRKRKRNELDDGFNNNPKSRPRKRTGDGFLVYTEEELGFNKADAGDTPLCPFDCNCCF